MRARHAGARRQGRGPYCSSMSTGEAVDQHKDAVDESASSRSERAVSFEEFKLYFDSAERVTERRIAMNRHNYSVSAAILVAVAAIANFAITNERVRFIAICAILALSATTIIFCSYWIQQIDDSKQLNNAKFELLNEMAPRLVFEAGGFTSQAKSYSPLQKEWDRLEKMQALGRVSVGRRPALLALKSSRAEYFVPQSLRIMFGGVFVAALIATAASWDVIGTDLSPFPSPSGATSPSPEGPQTSPTPAVTPPLRPTSRQSSP